MNSLQFKKLVTRGPVPRTLYIKNTSSCLNTIQTRKFSHTNFTFGGGHHHEQPDEDDIKYGIQVPKPSKFDSLAAKFLGANLVFWLWLNLVHKDGYKRIFALERPHFEHPLDDELSDDDDEFWQENDPTYFKTNKDELETILEWYKYRGGNRHADFSENVKRWTGKWE